MRYKIILCGCDDATEIVIALSDDEAALIRRIVRRSKTASKSACMPRLTIQKVKP